VNRPEPEDYSLLRWLHCFLCNSSTGYVYNSVTQITENSLLKYSNSTDSFIFVILVTQKLNFYNIVSKSSVVQMTALS